MRKSFIMLWPQSIFENVHVFKDPGEIPEAFHNLGYDSSLLVGRNVSNILLPGVNIYQTGNSNKNLPKKLGDFFAILRIIFKKRPDIVMSYYRSPTSTLLPLVYRLINTLSPKNRKKTTKWVLKMDSDGEIVNAGLMKGKIVLTRLLSTLVFNRTIIESVQAREKLLQTPIVRRRIIHIPDTYSERLYPDYQAPESTRKPTVLTVARISREKGIEVLITSFKKVTEAFPKWTVDIIGKKEDDDYFDELKALCEKLELNEKVIFHGQVTSDSLRKAYRNSSIFCLPSYNESFGIARIEAIVNGLPVITTYAGGGNTLPGAIAVPCGSIENMSEALRVLMENKDERLRLARVGQKSLKSWRSLMSDLIDELNQKK